MIKKDLLILFFQRLVIFWNFIQPNLKKFCPKYWSQHKELYNADRAPKIFELAKKENQKNK